MKQRAKEGELTYQDIDQICMSRKNMGVKVQLSAQNIQMCRERGLSVAEKGKHLDGSEIEKGEVIPTMEVSKKERSGSENLMISFTVIFHKTPLVKLFNSNYFICVNSILNIYVIFYNRTKIYSS
jgi:hypothetical protein